MCYDDLARPPLPPGVGGGSNGEDIVLTAADGNRFNAYSARPMQPRAAGAQILIYPDVRGLHQFYRELALRFADAGISALAMDYFGRTAGLSPRDDKFEYMPHVQQLRLPGLFADATAALDNLRQGEGANRATFIVGFCMGGSLTIYSGTQDFGLAGLIGFYTGFGRKMDEQKGTALDVSPHVRYPFLGLYGGADQGITPEQIEQLDKNLDQSGVAHELKIYPGAPHSFFDRRQADFADASADAWTRLLGFIHAHSSN
jgi:carboxymethylenebutenolidase